MPKIEDYYNTAEVLTSVLDNELVNFFDDYMSRTGGIELQSQMSEWLKEASKSPKYNNTFSLLNYVWFILSSENSEKAEAPRAKYYEKRRQAKFYWTRVIKKEKENNYASGLLREDCESYFELLRLNTSNDMKRYTTEEEYLESRYQTIMDWGSNKNSSIISFPQIYHLKPNKIADYFFIDCAFKLFDYISEKLRGDVIRGYYLIYPRFVNEGVFAFSSFSKDMEAQVSGNSVIVVDNIDDKHNVVVKKLEGDFSDAVLNGTENELVSSLVKKGIITLRNDVLNPLDQHIFLKVYSSFSVEELNQGSKTISLLDLVKSSYKGRPRKEQFINVLESLQKLATYKVEVRETNGSGHLVGFGLISFFDLIFKTGELSDEDTVVDISIIDGAANKGMDIKKALDGVKEKDLSKLTIDVMPSQFIKKELRAAVSERNVKILTSVYDKEMPVKVRKMLTFLVQERVSIYPSQSYTIPYELFISKLRIEETKKKRIKEQIRSSIGYLKENNMVVSDFVMREYAVDISFIPLNDIEKQMYNFEDGVTLLDVEE